MLLACVPGSCGFTALAKVRIHLLSYRPMSTKPFRIGLTGGVVTGKSTAARFFGALGVPIIDTEQLTRHASASDQPPLERLVERFGPSILTRCGRLDTPTLRNIVCSQPKARVDLEALTHPAMGALVEAQSATCGGPYQILIIPLLLEQRLGQLLDRVLLVDCEQDLQIQRLQIRDGATFEQASAIVNAQPSRSARLRVTHDVITNNGDMSAVRDQVAALHVRYLALAHHSNHRGTHSAKAKGRLA